MNLLLAGLTGFVSWSFVEYALHNWGGHLAKGKNSFSREHLRHHAEKDYFSPPLKKLSFALPVLSAAALGLSTVMPGALSLAFSLGLGAGWLAYEVVHYRLHKVPPRNAWGRFLRRHHFSHHFRNPWKNHGVTSALWDRVFGTFVPVNEALLVPRSHALDWLLDENAQIKAEFAADYVLRERRKTADQMPSSGLSSIAS